MKELADFEEGDYDLPGVKNDPHSVAADDDVDDGDVDPLHCHLPLSQSTLRT